MIGDYEAAVYFKNRISRRVLPEQVASGRIDVDLADATQIMQAVSQAIPTKYPVTLLAAAAAFGMRSLSRPDKTTLRFWPFTYILIHNVISLSRLTDCQPCAIGRNIEQLAADVGPTPAPQRLASFIAPNSSMSPRQNHTFRAKAGAVGEFLTANRYVTDN